MYFVFDPGGSCAICLLFKWLTNDVKLLYVFSVQSLHRQMKPVLTVWDPSGLTMWLALLISGWVCGSLSFGLLMLVWLIMAWCLWFVLSKTLSICWPPPLTRSKKDNLKKKNKNGNINNWFSYTTQQRYISTLVDASI